MPVQDGHAPTFGDRLNYLPPPLNGIGLAEHVAVHKAARQLINVQGPTVNRVVRLVWMTSRSAEALLIPPSDGRIVAKARIDVLAPGQVGRPPIESPIVMPQPKDRRAQFLFDKVLAEPEAIQTVLGVNRRMKTELPTPLAQSASTSQGIATLATDDLGSFRSRLVRFTFAKR